MNALACFPLAVQQEFATGGLNRVSEGFGFRLNSHLVAV